MQDLTKKGLFRIKRKRTLQYPAGYWRVYYFIDLASKSFTGKDLAEAIREYMRLQIVACSPELITWCSNSKSTLSRYLKIADRDMHRVVNLRISNHAPYGDRLLKPTEDFEQTILEVRINMNKSRKALALQVLEKINKIRAFFEKGEER